MDVVTQAFAAQVTEQQPGAPSACTSPSAEMKSPPQTPIAQTAQVDKKQPLFQTPPGQTRKPWDVDVQRQIKAGIFIGEQFRRRQRQSHRQKKKLIIPEHAMITMLHEAAQKVGKDIDTKIIFRKSVAEFIHKIAEAHLTGLFKLAGEIAEREGSDTVEEDDLDYASFRDEDHMQKSRIQFDADLKASRDGNDGGISELLINADFRTTNDTGPYTPKKFTVDATMQDD